MASEAAPQPSPTNSPGQENTATAASPQANAPQAGAPQTNAPRADAANEISLIENSKPDVPSILKDALPRPVSLEECVQTSIASRRVFNSFSGRVIVEQLTAFDPQVADQAVKGAFAQFDPTLSALLAGNHIDRPPSSFFGPGIALNTRQDEGEFMTRLSKIWPTGLTTSMGYEPSLAYLYFPLGNSSGFNPTHASDLVTRVNQPLLRGGNRNANLATLRVAQQRSAQSRVQVETAMQAQLRSIEQVYWILHANHVRLRAVDEAIMLAWRTRELVRLRFEAERAIYSDVARVSVALENLIQQRLQAELQIRKSSYDLSQLVGLELGESVVLVPVDNPERQPPEFNADAVVASAVEGNLDLRRQRQEIEIRRQFVTATSNQRLPQLDFQALHRTSGLQDDLGSALHQMIGFEYNDYSLGLQFSQQLGYRAASSRYRTAQLDVARQAALLTALERQVGFDVLTLLSQLKQAYGAYESSLRQLSEAQRWVQLAQTRYEDPPLQRGESVLVLLLDYQTAVQAKVDAIEQVADRLAEYNGLLAAIEERRGNILEKWYIVVQSDEEPESDLVKPASDSPPPAAETLPAPTAAGG